MADSKPATIIRNSITTKSMDITEVRYKTLRGWGII